MANAKANSNSKYKNIKLTLFDEKNLSLFSNFSRKFYKSAETTDLEFLRWKFKNRNGQKSYHLTHEIDGVLAGRAVLQERQFLVGQKSYSVTQVNDLLVDPDMQDGSVLFSLVWSYKSLESHFVFHTSNERSERLYKKIFKFDIPCVLDFFAIPLRCENLIDKTKEQKLMLFGLKLASLFVNFYFFMLFKFFNLFPSIKVVKQPIFSCLEKSFYAQTILSHGANMGRSLDFVKWRFQDCPFRYDGLLLQDKGKTIAQVIYRFINVDNRRTLAVMDILSPKELSLIGRMKLVSYLWKIAQNEGLDLVCLIGNGNNTFLKKFVFLSFLKVPVHYLPHETPIFIHGLDAGNFSDKIKNAYLTVGDLDYF